MTSLPLSDSKPHYHLLDGLRGVAALMVIIYHLGEGFATSPIDQWCNHGYLAVQFFFVLSGFVISYAYDNRWASGFTFKRFAIRRLVRLHPVVIIGTILGVIAFLLQGSVKWDGEHVALSTVMLAMLATMFMIPVSPSSPLDVRGNGEIYPLNGPFWSLFVEYVGNVFYALFLRRFSTKVLAAWCLLTGIGTAWYTLSNGSGYYHVGTGWTLADGGLWYGILTMSFCFSAGMLVQRLIVPIPVKGAFWLCSLVLIVLLAIPYVGGPEPNWLNGLYDLVCLVVVWPLMVWVAASGNTTDAFSTGVCNFCGRLSYPLYAVHYPSMYLFYAWVWNNGYGFSQVWPVAVGLVVGNIVLAYVVLRFYDMPLRKWLSSHSWAR